MSTDFPSMIAVMLAPLPRWATMRCFGKRSRNWCTIDSQERPWKPYLRIPASQYFFGNGRRGRHFRHRRVERGVETRELHRDAGIELLHFANQGDCGGDVKRREVGGGFQRF